MAASRWLQVLTAAVQAAVDRSSGSQQAALPAKTATNKARQESIKPTGSRLQHYKPLCTAISSQNSLLQTGSNIVVSARWHTLTLPLTINSLQKTLFCSKTHKTAMQRLFSHFNPSQASPDKAIPRKVSPFQESPRKVRD